MKRVVLIIASIVVVAVGVGGFFYYKSINEDKNNPKELFISYYDDLKNKDYSNIAVIPICKAAPAFIPL